MRRSRTALLSLLISAPLVFGSISARAELSAKDRATASSFFEAGAQAFDAGQYLVAAEAFLKAHTILDSPALLFSAAQAYRRQYVLDQSAEALQGAVALYRDYLRSDATGKRREDAMQALTDLAPLEARLGARRSTIAAAGAQGAGGKPGMIPIAVPIPGSPSGAGGAGGAAGAPGPEGGASETAGQSDALPAPAPRSTRLLLTAKPASAEVSVDGGAFVRVPAVVEVKSGPHAVRVRAEGYYDEDLSVPAVQNELVPSHVALRPKAGRLLVTGTAGARVSIDGQVRAALPMDRPLDVDPGEHFVTVARAGRVSLGKSIVIERDKEAPLPADLPMTGQRIAAWTTLGVGLAGAAVGGALVGLMRNRDATAAAVEEKRKAGVLSEAERDDYNSALRSRNDLALAAGITGGAAGLVLLGSLGLFLFDEPEALPIPSRSSDTNTNTKGSPVRLEYTLGLGSVGLRGTF